MELTLQPSTSQLRGLSSHHQGAAQDLIIHDRPGSNSIGNALSGVGRFNADMWRLGLSKSPASNCGADQQTANNIITECPLYRPPNDFHGLIDADADATTCEWLPIGRGDNQVKSRQVKLYCSISGNYAHNESSQKYKQDMNRKKIHINVNCASLKVCIVNSDCLWNKAGKISASHGRR